MVLEDLQLPGASHEITVYEVLEDRNRRAPHQGALDPVQWRQADEVVQAPLVKLAEVLQLDVGHQLKDEPFVV